MSEATETDLMRGDDVQQGGMFSYVTLESRVPPSHPLRWIKALLDEALADLSRDFDREGRPSIPSERLVRASTLQILYSIRSERLLCEQLDYNLFAGSWGCRSMSRFGITRASRRTATG